MTELLVLIPLGITITTLALQLRLLHALRRDLHAQTGSSVQPPPLQ